MLERVWRKGNPTTLCIHTHIHPHTHSWWECELVQPFWKTVWRFLKKLKIELPYDSAIPFLSIYPDKITSQKDKCTHTYIAALFTVAKIRKQMSINR